MAKVLGQLCSIPTCAIACVVWVVASGAYADEPSAQAHEASTQEDEEPVLGVAASVEQTYGPGHDIDPTASASVVTLRDRTASGEGMRDVLPEVPGLRVMAASAEGQYAGVRIRGADLANTTYMIGDVPVSGADTGGFDIGALPIRLFERVEVYRGGAPAWYAENAIGGVVRFVPARVIDNRLGMSLTTGSFHAASGELEASARARGFSLFTNVGMAGAKNDYTFRNDNGTLLDPRDDTEDRRRNAQYMREHLFVYGRQVLGGLTIDVLYFGFANRRGDPSPGDRQALSSRAHLLRNFASVALTYEDHVRGHRYKLQVIGSITRERLRYRDPNGEVGLSPDDALMRTTSYHGRFAASFDVTRWLEISSVNTARRDGISQFDTTELDQIPSAERATVTTAGEIRAHGNIGGVRGELRASAQYRFSRLDIPYDSVDGIMTNARSFGTPTFRAGGALAPTSWLTLNVSAFSGSRLPTLLETFGNFSNVVPAPNLKPERSVGFDGGATICRAFGQLTLSAELRAFRNDVSDLIRITMTSQRTARAANVESGLLRGIESSLDARIASHLRVEGNVTYIRTTTTGGFEVPLMPRVTAHGSATFTTGPIGRVLDDIAVHFGVTHLGKSFSDPANLVRFPTRTWMEAGARVYALDRRLSLGVTVRDLANVGGRDYLGYVLPGRRVTASIAFEQEIP